MFSARVLSPLPEKPLQEDSVEGKKAKNRKLCLQRRAILKLMVIAPTVGWMSMSSLAAQVARMLPESAAENVGAIDGDAYRPKILNPHEWQAVQVLSDWIIPADENSGSASDADVPEFLDDWLDFQRGDLLTEIRYGLAWLNAACLHAFQHNFVDCLPSQQAQILDSIAYAQKAAPEDARAVEFFNRLRDLVLSGYYTSEMGIRDLQYLGNEPQPSWQGCPDSVFAKIEQNQASAAPKS